ncbi:DNA-directed RNA polymerase III subunit RPC3 [Hyalella azteca]|uniref:DNA-directed RNA polymerase III subunit RPC3 n=1 Tax=Hyalella azteca TaxID=294128 RepID=A0A8B7NWM2_HYAAZ|nr:DNA-directed RNA polymerase III subunit RPC3 [Hyalella azteca]
MSVIFNLFNSIAFERTASKIVETFFDSIVASVVKALYRSSGESLQSITRLTHLPSKQVLQALVSLIQHNLASFEYTPQRQVHYRLNKANIFYLLRKNKYIHHVREKLGVAAELVVERVLEEGSITASQVIVCTTCKLLMTDLSSAVDRANQNPGDRHIIVRDALRQLIELGYLERCASPSSPAPPCCPLLVKPSSDDKHRFLPDDHLNLQLIAQAVTENVETSSSSSGAILPDASSFPDGKIYWRLNYDAFHLQWRDTLLVTSVEKNVGAEVGLVFRGLLQVAYSTVEDKWQSGVYTTAAHVKHALNSAPHLEHCLQLLGEGESGGCVRRIGVGGGGGEYQIEVAQLVAHITAEFLAKRIKEMFGSKAARVFRLVMRNHIVSADMIASACLLDKKEADQVSNMLFLNQILLVHDLRKASMPSSHTPELLFFKVNFLEVVRLTASQCFTELYNLLRKRELLTEKNRSLMEKKTRVDAIVDNIVKSGATQEQIQDIEEMLTDAERTAVTKWLKQQDQILTVVSGITDDIFLFELFSRYYCHVDDLSVGRSAA